MAWRSFIDMRHQQDIYESFIVSYDNNAAAAIVSFTSDKSEAFTSGYHVDSIKKDWIPWFGSSNNEPKMLMQALMLNNMALEIINTKVDFICGKGIALFRKEITPEGKRKVTQVENIEIQSFLDSNNVNEVMRNACMDLLCMGNFWLYANRNKGGKIYSFRHYDATLVRIRKPSSDFSEVQGYFICPNWSNPIWDKKDENKGNVRYVPKYQGQKKQPEFMFHGRNYIPGQPFYAIPPWYGGLNWIKLSNEIPLWHLNGIRNGYNIRYHIQIPMSYFDKFSDDKAKIQAKEDLRVQMEQWLSGAEGNGKSFVNYFRGEMDLFKIQPLSADLKDSAYKDLFAQSNVAATSGHGIAPTLAGIETDGKLSSGSEKRIAYNIYMELKTPGPRLLLTKFLREIIWPVMGWPSDIYPDFISTEITTLDKNPTGTQTVV